MMGKKKRAGKMPRWNDNASGQRSVKYLRPDTGGQTELERSVEFGFSGNVGGLANLPPADLDNLFDALASGKDGE